jgi:K+-sensing histidine kinase KdpD
LPDADLALVLVVVIATLGWLAGARAALISATCAAVAFDVLDTRPYGALTMTRGVDVATALILLATGLLVGAGAARLARYRTSEDHRSDALAVVMEASGLVATGEQHQLITEALREELLRALDLAACEFHSQPPTGTRPLVTREGGVVGLLSGPADQKASQMDLPVWCQGQIAAHYRLTLGHKRPTPGELRVALSLADQAGAAMANINPLPPRPKEPGRLRLVPSSDKPVSL